MKKTLIALAMSSICGVSQAATLNANSTYDMFINADTSCFSFIGDCRDLTQTTVSSGAVMRINTTSDGLGGVDFTITSASELQYLNTPLGIFTLDNLVGGYGSVDSSGNITYTPEGRIASAQFHPYAGTPPWNINNSNLPNASDGYVGFTSGSMTALTLDEPGQQILNGFTLTGSTLDDNLNAVIISASNLGIFWGNGFTGAPYSELWDVNFVEVSAVPVPAAIWLFGSGLLAFSGFVRRRELRE